MRRCPMRSRALSMSSAKRPLASRSRSMEARIPRVSGAFPLPVTRQSAPWVSLVSRAVLRVVWSESRVITRPSTETRSSGACTAAAPPPSSLKARLASGARVAWSTRVAVSWWPAPLRFAPRMRLPSTATARPRFGRAVAKRCSAASNRSGSTEETTRCRVDLGTGTSGRSPGLSRRRALPAPAATACPRTQWCRATVASRRTRSRGSGGRTVTSASGKPSGVLSKRGLASARRPMPPSWPNRRRKAGARSNRPRREPEAPTKPGVGSPWAGAAARLTHGGPCCYGCRRADARDMTSVGNTARDLPRAAGTG